MKKYESLYRKRLIQICIKCKKSRVTSKKEYVIVKFWFG